MKARLTIDLLISEAENFCIQESNYDNPDLYGIIDGKAVGTYTEKLKPKDLEFLKDRMIPVDNWVKANQILLELSGINDFFRTPEEFSDFKECMKPVYSIQEAISRREYGDFQTPNELTDLICYWLKTRNIQPAVILEPTFGKGSFLISSLKSFPQCELIMGIEIYPPYYWETKFKILEFFLDYPSANKPSVLLYQADIFKFDFRTIAPFIKDKNLLILGNPPWVTNSELSALDSNNLPDKSNFKNHKGLDAITGKGNFDICEYIILMMLEEFSNCDGWLAMLAKNSVIKNIVYELPKKKYRISGLRALQIDAKKHFNAAVEASLFTCKLNERESRFHCRASNFQNPDAIEKDFGWVADKFISHIRDYEENYRYDGLSPYEWRQGVKHDCAKVFELKRETGKLINGFSEELDIEEELVYGLVKSSDIKKWVISRPTKSVIIPQTRIGENTSYIRIKYPKLYAYLTRYQHLLQRRKSSIYKNAPPFSIFGIGDYSFKPYKIAVSGLYKEPRFALLLPEDKKPVMVDDTCYLLSFEELSEAVFVWALLNHCHTRELLSSITFLDSKRPFTKDILMRLALHRLANDLSFEEIANGVRALSDHLIDKIDEEKWNAFLLSLATAAKSELQLELF